MPIKTNQRSILAGGPNSAASTVKTAVVLLLLSVMALSVVEAANTVYSMKYNKYRNDRIGGKDLGGWKGWKNTGDDYCLEITSSSALSQSDFPSRLTDRTSGGNYDKLRYDRKDNKNPYAETCDDRGCDGSTNSAEGYTMTKC